MDYGKPRDNMAMNTSSTKLAGPGEGKSHITVNAPHKNIRSFHESTGDCKKISSDTAELATDSSIFAILLDPVSMEHQCSVGCMPEKYLPRCQPPQLHGESSITTDGAYAFEDDLLGILQSSRENPIEATLLMPSLGTVQITAGPQNNPWLLTVTTASNEIARWLQARRNTLESSLSQTLKTRIELRFFYKEQK